jgi:excisionase family DNA binding protein
MKIIAVPEVARLLGLNRKTVYAYAARGDIPCRRVGRRFLFLESALKEWLSEYPQGVTNMYVIRRATELGMEVVDADQPVQIVVTVDDILKAKKANSRTCALAKASSRLPGVRTGYFFRSIAYLEYKNRMVRFAIPQSLQKEIVSFDRSHIFAPGIYQLSVPVPSGRYKKSNDKNKKSNTKAETPKSPNRKSTVRVRSQYVRHARDPRAA